MRRIGKLRYARQSQGGLTLLELLVVLGIIAAVAGIGVQVYTGVNDDAEEALVRSEMRQIVSAIQRFRADTGYFPKQGPFDTTFDGVASTDAGDGDDGTFDQSPANLRQLFEPSFTEFDDAGTRVVRQIMEFDEDSGTGWNGPYVTELDALRVNVGTNLQPSGTGFPEQGTFSNGCPLDQAACGVRAIGDTFAAQPIGDYFRWVNAGGNVEFDPNLGRPYYYFSADTAVGVVQGCVVPCLVSAGPDGVYEAGDSDGDAVDDGRGSGDDIVINIGRSN
ncbi:MAG: prepilin-type N-terminal cleavage/methylation domain-containing protein [Pseudomonadota bacterium]